MSWTHEKLEDCTLQMERKHLIEYRDTFFPGRKPKAEYFRIVSKLIGGK